MTRMFQTSETRRRKGGKLGNLRIVSLLLLFACDDFARAAKLSPAEAVIDQLLDQGALNCDLSVIPADQKVAVVARLRETAGTNATSLIGNTVLHSMEADLLLLRLGDVFTIERMFNVYRAYDSRTSWDYVQTRFERSRQPAIIPYLAVDFYSTEDPAKGFTVKAPPGSVDFAVGVPPRSIFSGVTAIRIIEKSPLFSSEMKAWAAQAYALRVKSPEQFRGLMRVWWEANKAEFERGNYLAVRPIAVGNVTSGATDATPPFAASSESTSVHSSPRPAVASNPPTVVPDPKSENSTVAAIAARRPIWPWVAGLSALVMVVIGALSRRRR